MAARHCLRKQRQQQWKRTVFVAQWVQSWRLLVQLGEQLTTAHGLLCGGGRPLSSWSVEKRLCSGYHKSMSSAERELKCGGGPQLLEPVTRWNASFLVVSNGLLRRVIGESGDIGTLRKGATHFILPTECYLRWCTPGGSSCMMMALSLNKVNPRDWKA